MVMLEDKANDTLRRTVPFLLARTDNASMSFMLDSVEVAPGGAPGTVFLERVAENLDLLAISPFFPEEVAAEIISEQYDVCLNYIYSHPVWEEFRSGQELSALLAYMLETRHYLDAAASRMAPGPASCWHEGSTVLSLAEHLIEEADHARFFEEALELLGCKKQTVSDSRPSPITLEWIYLMRTLATRGPLIAATCSGLMETSAKDRDVVLNWHKMLTERNLLPEPVVNAFLQHVHLDYELGHGANWREVLKYEAPITASQLRDCLNSICAVAEMVFRWCGMLQTGLSGDIVQVIPEIQTSRQSQPLSNVDLIFKGLPIWPAELLHQVSYGFSNPSGTREVIGLAYHFDNCIVGNNQNTVEVLKSASALYSKLAATKTEINTIHAVEDLLNSWLRTIEGHQLWTDMLERPTVTLIYGWLLENYYYLSAAPHHVSAAIAGCQDASVRKELLEHLEEEAEHGNILKVALEAANGPIAIESSRPLPTSIAFVGYLSELASLDWKAYCLAIGYLQLTLASGRDRVNKFYKTVADLCPDAEALLNAMRKHDVIDQDLGHDDNVKRLVTILYERHSIDEITLARVAILAQLAWSFLDGIRVHYRNGPSSLAQRLGWSCNQMA